MSKFFYLRIDPFRHGFVPPKTIRKLRKLFRFVKMTETWQSYTVTRGIYLRHRIKDFISEVQVLQNKKDYLTH